MANLIREEPAEREHPGAISENVWQREGKNQFTDPTGRRSLRKRKTVNSHGAANSVCGAGEKGRRRRGEAQRVEQ